MLVMNLWHERSRRNMKKCKNVNGKIFRSTQPQVELHHPFAAASLFILCTYWNKIYEATFTNEMDLKKNMEKK